jgi:hypothetical protein
MIGQGPTGRCVEKQRPAKDILMHVLNVRRQAISRLASTSRWARTPLTATSAVVLELEHQQSRFRLKHPMPLDAFS